MPLKLRSKSKKQERQDAAASKEEKEPRKDMPKQKKSFFRKSSKKKAKEDAKETKLLKAEDKPEKVEENQVKVEEPKEEEPDEGRTDEESESSTEPVAPVRSTDDDSDISGWLEGDAQKEKQTPEEHEKEPLDDEEHADPMIKSDDASETLEGAKNEEAAKKEEKHSFDETPEQETAKLTKEDLPVEEEQVVHKSRGAKLVEEDEINEKTAKSAYMCCGISW